MAVVNKKKLALAVSSALAWMPAMAAQSDDEKMLESVVVVGEKIERRLDETTSSVSVTTARDIAEHGDGTLYDITARTPGVYTQSGFENWGIRGVPVAGFDEQGPATTNGAVSVYVDGALQPHRSLTLSPFSLWDVEQVEVYRGPQSTLQGRNALAGSVVFQTKDPTFKPALAVQGNVGKYGERGTSMVVGGGLVPGVVAARLAVDFQESDGYIRNDALGTDANPLRNKTARGKVLIRPSDKTEVLLTLAHSDNQRGVQAVNADNGEPRYYSIRYNTREFDSVKQDSLTAKVDHYLNDAWTLTSITSGTDMTYRSRLDFDQTDVDTFVVNRNQKSKLLNQELRAGYKSDALRAQFGVYLGQIKNKIDDELTVDGAAFGVVNGDTRIRNHAVFGEVNWDVAPRWQLIAGLRYDQERNRTELQDQFAGEEFSNERKTFDALLPKAGVTYKLAQDHSLGFVAQRGYRAGGVNVRSGASHTPYDAEYTTNYELSYRGAWLNKRLRTTANLYYTDWKDQQVAFLDENDNLQVANAGRSRMKGLEIGADYRVSPALSVFTGASYNNTKYREFVLSGADLSGQQFLFAPKIKLHLGATYRFDERLSMTVDTIYQEGSPSSYDTGAGGAVTGVRRSDDHTLVNISARYRVGKATLSAYVRNLLDKEYIANNQSGDILDVGAPRTFGVALRYDFW